MKLRKRIAATMMALVVVASQSQVLFAQDNIATQEISISNGSVKTISMDEVPDHVTPLELDSIEELNIFLDDVNTQLDALENREDNVISINPYSRATYRYDVLIDSEKVGYATVGLYIDYKTSLDSNRGTIEYVRPFTTFTGYNLGFDWVEKECDADVGDKDAYVYARGVVDYYILVDGLVKYYSRPIRLDGTVWLIR